jgi:hypothetical protein
LIRSIHRGGTVDRVDETLMEEVAVRPPNARGDHEIAESKV